MIWVKRWNFYVRNYNVSGGNTARKYLRIWYHHTTNLYEERILTKPANKWKVSFMHKYGQLDGMNCLGVFFVCVWQKVNHHHHVASSQTGHWFQVHIRCCNVRAVNSGSGTLKIRVRDKSSMFQTWNLIFFFCIYTTNPWNCIRIYLSLLCFFIILLHKNDFQIEIHQWT